MQPSFPTGLSVRIWPSQAAKLHHCAQWVQSKPHSDDLSLKSQTRAPHRSAETSSGSASGSWWSWSAFRQWVITAVSAAQHHLCSLFQMENRCSRLQTSSGTIHPSPTLDTAAILLLDLTVVLRTPQSEPAHQRALNLQPQWYFHILNQAYRYNIKCFWWRFVWIRWWLDNS